jgi:heavy metal sensor kinase
VEPGGRVVAAWGDRVARRPMLGAAERARVVRGERILRSWDGFRLAALRTHDGHVVAVAESLAGVRRAVRRVLVLLLIAGPAALLVTALGGWWLAGRALRPVERMRARAAAIGPERLDERLAVPPTRDEIARLATTLNEMLERIQSGAEEQRRLVADASHELRSPLAAMRAELDVSLLADHLPQEARAVLESAREEVDRMGRTVDDLLTLASADEGRLALLARPLDLADVAAAAASGLTALADGRAVRVVVEGEDAPAHGDAERLRHALRNMLENAIDFSPPGGEVAVATWRRGGEVGVTVSDDGPGIPPELRERVFDRFFRVDRARERATGGSGLGLAITRELALAHGGRVWAEARAPRGSAFSLALPAAPSPQRVPAATR